MSLRDFRQSTEPLEDLRAKRLTLENWKIYLWASRWDVSDTQGTVAYRSPWKAEDSLVQEDNEVLPLLVGLSRPEIASESPCKADWSSILGHLASHLTSLSLSFHINQMGIIG